MTGETKGVSNDEFAAGFGEDAAARPVKDPVMQLKSALSEEFARFLSTVQAKLPDSDPLSLASLLMDYGIEVGLASGSVTNAIMADYLRAMADAVDTDAAVWPALCLQSEESVVEPPF